MLESPDATDHVFHALADRTRRGLIERLSRGPATVSELARPLPMSLAAVLQHLHVLEDSGVVVTRKVGRVRTCQLNPEGLVRAEHWIAERRELWEGRFDRLGALLEPDGPPGPDAVSSEATDPEPRRRRGGTHEPTEGEET
jgi:DNA-binding transcriptional ArsR family regulator